MGVTPFQAVPGNRAGCRGTRGARPRSCRACPPLAGGARCPPRGPGMWWHSSALAHLWGWGRGGGRGGRAGTPCTIPMDGIDCPKGPPPVPSGMGRGPGQPVSIRWCITARFGVGTMLPRGVPRYSPCLPQASPSQGDTGDRQEREPSSHSGSEGKAGARSALSRVSHGNRAALCPRATAWHAWLVSRTRRLL